MTSRSLTFRARPLLAALLLSGLAQAAVAQEPARGAMPATITVTGEATVSAAPDLASFGIGVTTQGQSAAEALSGNSTAMAAVIARLKEAGVAEKDIQTSGLSVSPNWTGYDSSSGEEPRITGYTASNMVTVQVKALALLGPALDAAVKDGANTLNGVNFELSDSRPVMDEARRAAVADARARAELLTEAAGVKLGPILSISEGGQSGPMPVAVRFAAEAAKDSVPVEQGEVNLRASVTIVWQIRP